MDCNICGACCRMYPLFASKADAAREPRIRLEAVELPESVQSEFRAYELHRLPLIESCIFIGDDNRCTIYATRPDICRGFVPSVEACDRARARLVTTNSGCPEFDSGPLKRR